MDITFTQVTPADYSMMREWMNRPHWREWWGDPDEEFGFVIDMVEGRDTTRPYIFHVDGVPAGYIQVWYIGDHQCEPWTTDNPWLAELPAETVGVDLSIGEPSLLSKGIGTETLRQFVSMLVAEGRREIIIDPDPENGRAVRAYEKAGFRTIPELLGRTGDSLIMKCDLRTYGKNT